MIRFALFALSALLISCVSTRKLSVKESSFRRSGEFQMRTEGSNGSGSVIFREKQSSSQLYLYSPFGQKISQLSLKGDLLSIIDSEGNERHVSVDQSVDLSGFFTLNRLKYSELYTILSGRMPAFLNDAVSSLSGKDSVAVGGDTLSVIRKRGEIRELNLATPEFTLSLSGGKDTIFRQIRLETGRRNYFQIRYE